MKWPTLRLLPVAFVLYLVGFSLARIVNIWLGSVFFAAAAIVIARAFNPRRPRD